MIENNAWQRIPGTISCEIYPLEKKPNFQNSNAYIIRSETMFLVIDPGGEEQQRDVILDVISQSSPAKKNPGSHPANPLSYRSLITRSSL